jgi:hypothetical protein
MSTNDEKRVPGIAAQVERLAELGVPTQFGLSEKSLRDFANQLDRYPTKALIVASGKPSNYSALTQLIQYRGKRGFVVVDFTDAADYEVFEGSDQHAVQMTENDWYLLVDPQRGDEFESASPSEALAEVTASNRVALSIVEGLMLAIQAPGMLERNHCYMTIASRKKKANGGFDARTPALWISNGTGRDAEENEDAPKLGWCWWNNRHTWLGIAHADRRQF